MPDNPRTRSDSNGPRHPRDMNLVEIAGELEQITSSIEKERSRERAARADFDAVVEAVNARVRDIRARAKVLVEEQRRRMSGFDGMLTQPGGTESSVTEIKPQQRRTMPEAVLAIWTDGGYTEPLTTEEIAIALEEIGYRSKAAPKSLKSSINQTIAKLCNAGQLLKFRSDGTPLDETEGVRARRYLPADFASQSAD